MQAAVVIGLTLLVATSTAARAAPADPLRITIECEGDSRTKACPAFLLGFVEASRLFLSSPRAAADVVLYASTTEVAQLDHVHLRFVGKVAGAPPVVEVDVDVDTRADDDTQRVQLEPAFARGIALFAAAKHPTSVAIAFTAPDGEQAVAPKTSPYGVTLQLGGFGNYTKQFQSYQAASSLEVSRLTAESRATASLSAQGGVNRQPPLVLEDGTRVSLDTSQWHAAASAEGAYLLCSCWSVGGVTRAWRDDPKGQFRYGWSASGGIEWDKYKANDPRGNRLAVLAALGWQAERYNLRNEIGEGFAQYPIGALVTSGSVRKDKIAIGLSLSLSGELDHPTRRHSLSASPFVEMQLGGHVDIGASFSITQRALPGPDVSLIDPADFEQLSRLSYAEPLQLNGSLNLSIHWDRTNGARNDRLGDL